MFEIIEKTVVSPGIKKFVVNAPLVASSVRPGQFIIILISDKGERIPLTVVETVGENIVLIVQEVGKTTMELGSMKAGDKLLCVLGPLGYPTEVKKYGRVITIGGGVGVAEVYPVSKALKIAGNEVISIIGARHRDLLILEKEMRQLTDNLYVATDDGSYGIKGNVGDVLKDIILTHRPDFVYAIGPVPMMKAVSEITKVYGIKTVVSLNPIMVDGTGMCGSCRIKVGGTTKFSCVDGPEFDAHEVDWDELLQRLRLFLNEEKKAVEHYCKLKQIADGTVKEL